MSRLSESANCIIRLYPDARARAVCQEGISAVYFIGGQMQGTRDILPQPLWQSQLYRVMQIGNETYRLKIFRESTSPMYKYPFYVYQKPRRERA